MALPASQQSAPTAAHTDEVGDALSKISDMTDVRRRFIVMEGGGERHPSTPPDLFALPRMEPRNEQLLLGGWGTLPVPGACSA